MQKQKERSSSKSKIKYSDWNIIDENAESNFIGYDKLKSEMNLIRFREIETENGMNWCGAPVAPLRLNIDVFGL